jgi:hypothetical protein
MNGSGRLAYPERLSMWLQTCWRRRKTLVGYVPFDRMMDTSPRLPSRCHHCETILQFQLGRKSGAAVVESARPPCGRSASAFADARTFPMLAVDNQATGLLFIHDSIRRRIDAHRAFRALLPRSARTRSAPPVHLVASQPALSRHAESPKPGAFGVLVSHISQFIWGQGYVDTLPMSQNN